MTAAVVPPEYNNMVRYVALFISFLAAGAACGAPVSTPARYAALVVDRYPHDAQAFTQGLLYFQGTLYESTGLHGQSMLRRVRLDNGRVEARVALPDRLFGEGLARVGQRLYQLTWKAGVALVYSLPDLRLMGHRNYSGQGWGLTWDGRHLIMSDGSATLRFINPDDFSVDRTLTVTNDQRPMARLNELEYFCDAIWANVRYADVILRIDPGNGAVTAVLDAAPLRQALPEPANAGVLNGIAWNPDRQRLLVTGKNWPLLFAVALPWACKPKQ